MVRTLCMYKKYLYMHRGMSLERFRADILDLEVDVCFHQNFQKA